MSMDKQKLAVAADTIATQWETLKDDRAASEARLLRGYQERLERDFVTTEQMKAIDKDMAFSWAYYVAKREAGNGRQI